MNTQVNENLRMVKSFELARLESDKNEIEYEAKKF